MPVEFRTIEPPSTWQIFPRHPAGEDYADLPAKLAKRMADGIAAYGVMQRPVVLKRESGGMYVLDGWQMYQGCILADVCPPFVELVAGITPEEFVEIKNDIRRHETVKERLARIRARTYRLGKLIANGQSVKQAAADEEVSVSQAYKDLANLPRCEHCTKAKQTGENCAACQLLRMDVEQKAEEPPPPPVAPVPEALPAMDAIFVTVPEHAIEAFLVAGELMHWCHEFDGLIKRLAKIIDNKVGARYISPTAAQRCADLRQHAWQARPAYVCAYCQGGNPECTGCRGEGWQSGPAFMQTPREMQDEMRKLGARNVPI